METINTTDVAEGCINIIVTDPDLVDRTSYPPDCVVLDYDVVMYHMGLVDILDPRTIHTAREVTGEEVLEYVRCARDVRALNRGFQHLIGRIDLHFKLCAHGLHPSQIVHQHPEAELHPKWQLALGDLFIGLYKQTLPRHP